MNTPPRTQPGPVGHHVTVGTLQDILRSVEHLTTPDWETGPVGSHVPVQLLDGSGDEDVWYELADLHQCREGMFSFRIRRISE